MQNNIIKRTRASEAGGWPLRYVKLKVFVLSVGLSHAAALSIPAPTQAIETLWDRNNLVAWCAVPYDAANRGPEERAEMLTRLGFKHFAYDWRPEHIPSFGAEIEALKKHGINLLAWWFPLKAEDPLARETLELFRRHEVRPQLWVTGTSSNLPKTPDEWAKLLPGITLPRTKEEVERFSNKDRETFFRVLAQLHAQDMPKTVQEQNQRILREANWIAALVTLAAPYGCKIQLYNHNGWFGNIDNQLAIINRLEEMGVSGVGIVYNFSHARDENHDDSKNFAELWHRMQKHVTVVNITGMRWEGQLVYPSEGDSELEMMRIIQESGWRGRVGLIAEKGGDAELTLRNCLIGLEWLTAELAQPGSGGTPPFSKRN